MPHRRLLRALMAGIAALAPAGACALALDPFLSPAPEGPDEPGFFSVTDDSFGPGPVDEWDDLDSFGLRFRVPIHRVSLLGAMSGITNRTDSAISASRIDEASVGAGYSVLEKEPVRLSLAAGVDLTGDFGGLLVQQASHSVMAVTRPVPQVYSGGFAAAPVGAFKLSFGTDEPLSPYAVLAGRGSVPARGSLLAVAGLRYARPGVLLALGAGWRAVGGAAPSRTIAALDSAENGPYLGFDMRVGALWLSFEDIPLLKKTNGSLGVALGRPLQGPGASPPLALDLGFLAGGCAAERVRLEVGLPQGSGSLRPGAFLSFAQGWFSSNHPGATETFFAEYDAGASADLPIGSGPFSIGVSLGPFLAFERLSTDTLAWSTPLGSRGSVGLVAEAGLHVDLPSPALPLGLGCRARWRPFEADVVRSGQSFAERGPFDFEIFVSSGS